MPKVSVIIPAYNAEQVLAESLESILGQSYTDFECIVIDDCSKDQTVKVAESYAKKDKRVKVHENKVNVGVGANRSKGIELASGQYICWQDADDIAMPDRLALQVQYLDEHPQVGLVGGFLDFFGEGVSPSTRKYKESDEALRKTIFRYNPVAQPGSMARAECYREVGGYDSKLRVSEDLDMLFRIGEKYKFGNVQKTVLRYRQDQSSLTGSNLRRMELETIRLRRKYAASPAYNPGFIDFAYNIAQLISIYIIPPKLKIALFNKLRNSS